MQWKRKRLPPLREVHHTVLHTLAERKTGTWLEISKANSRALIVNGLVLHKQHEQNPKLIYVRLKTE